MNLFGNGHDTISELTRCESRFSGLAGLWFVRCCLGVFCLAAMVLFTLQAFGLLGVQLGSSLVNWVGLMGLTSIIGLLVLAKVSKRMPNDH
jgi:hypothetical protein